MAIGVGCIYLLLSLVCSAINEGMASVLNQRGKHLFEGIKNLLNDGCWGATEYKTGLRKALDPKVRNQLPF